MRPASLPSVLIGFESLRANPLRTALAMLGIIIGSGSLVSVLSLGDAMERMGRDELARTTDVQTVSITSRTSEEIDGESVPRSDYPVFTPADASELSRLPGVAGVSLTLSGRAVAEGPRGARRPAGVTASLASTADFFNLDFLAGRYFTEVEVSHAAAVAVLTFRLAQELSPSGVPEQMIGELIRLHGAPVRIIGVLAARTGDKSRSAFVPFRLARAILAPFGGPRVPTLMVKSAVVEGVSGLQATVEDWLARRYGRWESRVKVETSQQRLEQVQRMVRTFKLFLGALTGISIVVGGIGIMNVLLASVTERTREIGVRKAIGARKRDVLWQFLSESVAISFTGSTLGVLLGVVAALVITAMVRSSTGADLTAAVSGGTLLVAVGMAVLVGITFGTYPALRASRLSPIDAIRHE